MNKKQWVQHKSGQGEKWEVVSKSVFAYEVLSKVKHWVFYLPISEYILCESPEEWEDVTERYDDEDVQIVCTKTLNPVRLRKVNQLHNGPAFIVERKKL